MSNIFWSNLFRQSNNEDTLVSELWQQTPLFDNIPARQTKYLASKMHVRDFRDNEIIFKNGDQGAGTILVLSGSVRIMVQDTELALLETGDFFGEIALAHTEQRAADAYAVGDCQLVFLLKQDIEEWIEYEPRLGAKFLMNLSSVLAHRLAEANKVIAEKQS